MKTAGDLHADTKYLLEFLYGQKGSAVALVEMTRLPERRSNTKVRIKRPQDRLTKFDVALISTSIGSTEADDPTDEIPEAAAQLRLRCRAGWFPIHPPGLWRSGALTS